MKLKVFGTVLATIAFAVTLAGQDVAREQKLQQAIDLLETKGDAAKAIPLLEEVAKSGDEALAARGLLYLGQAQERQGLAAARQTYANLVRRFPRHQAIMEQANVRLTALALSDVRRGGRRPNSEASSMTSRLIWTAPLGAFGLTGHVSPNGKLLPYVDPGSGDLFLHDTTTATDRRLTDRKASGIDLGSADSPVFSRDGRLIALGMGGGQARQEGGLLAVVEIPSSGTGKIRRLFQTPDVQEIYPLDWTPDGKQIAALVVRRDRTLQIGLVGTDDGRLRVLKSVGWRPFERIAISPDGRYLAVDLPHEKTRNRDIYILAMDGTSEVVAYGGPADDYLVGWSPDGRRLLFQSERGDTLGLWAIGLRDGRSLGAPELLKSDLGPVVPLGITPTGQFYYVVRGGFPRYEVRIGELSPATGAVNQVRGFATGAPYRRTSAPEWSPDGTRVAYVDQGVPLRNLDTPPVVVVVRSTASGQVQGELRPELEAVSHLRWSPDGRMLAAQGRDFQGRYGIFLLDAVTGAVKAVEVGPPGAAMVSRPEWSEDGRRIYYRRRVAFPGATQVVVERELGSAREREVLRAQMPVQLGGWLLAPDRRSAAAGVRVDEHTTAVLFFDLVAGTQTEAFRTAAPALVAPLMWTHGSDSLVVIRREQRGEPQLWSVPLRGPNGPTHLGPYSGFREPRLHPDGRTVAFWESEQRTRVPPEVWMLDNFLSVAAQR